MESNELLPSVYPGYGREIIHILLVYNGISQLAQLPR